jgi:hypothetical protein
LALIVSKYGGSSTTAQIPLSDGSDFWSGA